MLHSDSVTAYKVFELRSDGLHPNRIRRDDRPLPVGEWIVDQIQPGDEVCWMTAREREMTGVDGYPRGFHAFERPGDAELEASTAGTWRVYEVRIAEIVAEVTDPLGLTTCCGPAKTVVGRKMFIVGPSEEEFDLEVA